MYQLRPPALALAPYIEHYWFVSAADGPVDLKVDVFVDGRADLILNFSAPYERTVLGSQATRTITDSNLDAQRLQPIRIVQKGRVHTTGVRFRLGGLAPFVRVLLNTLTDTTPPPVQAFGDAFLATEAAIRSTDPDAQAQILDQFFLNQLQTPRSHTAFRQALDTLTTSDGAAPLHDVAAAAGVTPRHVERLFAQYLGLAPKTLARILRFQSTLRALMRDPGVPLAEMAAQRRLLRPGALHPRVSRPQRRRAPRVSRLLPPRRPPRLRPQRGRIHTRRRPRSGPMKGLPTRRIRCSPALEPAKTPGSSRPRP
jgi:AraC-like DNA-binding protein